MSSYFGIYFAFVLSTVSVCFVLGSLEVCWVGFGFITQLSLNWDYMVDCKSIRIEYRVLVVQNLYFVRFGSQRLHIFTRLVGTKFSLKV